LTFCTSFLSRRRYVEERYGAGSFQKVRDGLVARHGIELPPIIAPGGWYPSRAFAFGLDIARNQWGAPRFHEDFGRKAAEYEIHWVYRVILKFTSPLWLLEQGTAVWNKSHDTGSWTIEGRDGWLRGTLRDFGLVHSGYCRSLGSWIKRACEMTGTATIQVWHPQCRVNGNEACVFEGEW
jgi:hypothetical protein